MHIDVRKHFDHLLLPIDNEIQFLDHLTTTPKTQSLTGMSMK